MTADAAYFAFYWVVSFIGIGLGVFNVILFRRQLAILRQIRDGLIFGAPVAAKRGDNA